MNKPFGLIEMTGLPGAGKSTVFRTVSAPHLGRSHLKWRGIRPAWPIIPLAWHLLRLGLAVRPVSRERLWRCVTLPAVVLRLYSQPSDAPIVLEQGFAQALWSILIGAKRVPQDRLVCVVGAFRHYAPDIIVALDASVDLALQRLRCRVGGRSRFDRYPPDKARHMLHEDAAMLDQIIGLLTNEGSTRLVRLDGATDFPVNAAAIDRIILNTAN